MPVTIDAGHALKKYFLINVYIFECKSNCKTEMNGTI